MASNSFDTVHSMFSVEMAVFPEPLKWMDHNCLKQYIQCFLWKWQYFRNASNEWITIVWYSVYGVFCGNSSVLMNIWLLIVMIQCTQCCLWKWQLRNTSSQWDPLVWYSQSNFVCWNGSTLRNTSKPMDSNSSVTVHPMLLVEMAVLSGTSKTCRFQ